MPIETPRAAHRNESFWQISWPPSCFRSIARILPGYGAANATCCLPRALVGEHRHEQALTGDQPLAGAEQRAHDAAALLLAAVAEHRLHLDAGRHVHHRAGFGDGALARIELDLDELHLAADDAGSRSRARGGPARSAAARAAAARAGAAGQERGELRHVLERRPVLHARRRTPACCRRSCRSAGW